MRNLPIKRVTATRAGRPILLAAAVCFAALCANLLGGERFVPHVIDGGGLLGGQITRLQTFIDVLNLSDEPIEVEVILTTDDGEPFNAFLVSSIHGGFSNRRVLTLASGELGRFFTSTFGELTTGWGMVRASGAVGIQVNLSRQITLPGESPFRLASRASYPPPELSSQFRTFQEFDFGLGENDVGLALLNPSETETAEVRIALVDLGGANEVERSLTIAPRQKIARFLKSDLFAGSGLGVFSSVSVTSSIPISALPVSVDGDSWTAGPLLMSRPLPDGAP